MVAALAVPVRTRDRHCNAHTAARCARLRCVWQPNALFFGTSQCECIESIGQRHVLYMQICGEGHGCTEHPIYFPCATLGEFSPCGHPSSWGPAVAASAPPRQYVPPTQNGPSSSSPPKAKATTPYRDPSAAGDHQVHW